jgi:hypothetical protein
VTELDPNAGDPTLFLWMTREEFLVTYAYQLVAWWHPAYFGAEIPSAERDEKFEDFEWAMKFAVKELNDQGFRYTGLEVNHSGEVKRGQDEPVETRNALFLAKMNMGRMPNPVAACQCALDEIERRALPIDRAPIFAVMEQCQKDARAAERELQRDPETFDAANKWLEDQMKSAGMKKEGWTN